MFKEAESRPDKIESTSNNVQVRKKQQHRRRACDLLEAAEATISGDTALPTSVSDIPDVQLALIHQ